MDCLNAELFLNSCFSGYCLCDFVPRTAVERASRGVDKLLRTGGVPTSLTFIVLAVADGLFGLYGSERRDELFISTRPPPTPCPRSL